MSVNEGDEMDEDEDEDWMRTERRWRSLALGTVCEALGVGFGIDGKKAWNAHTITGKISGSNIGEQKMGIHNPLFNPHA